MSRSHAHRPRKTSLAEWALAIAILALIFLAAAAPALSKAQTPRAFTSVRIEAGATLWQLAKAHPVPGMSTEQVVDVIKRTNHLDGAPVAGEVVQLPSQDGQNGAVCSR